MEDRERLARIEVKLDQIRESLPDHETRIRSLEKWRWWLAGAGGAVGSAIAWLASKL